MVHPKRQLALMVVVFLALGCSIKRLSVEQQYLWCLNVYEQQWDMYFDQVIDPGISAEEREMLRQDPDKITGDMIRTDLTDDEREILRKKRRILQDIQPKLLAWDVFRRGGSTAPAELRESVTELINSIIGGY